MINIICFVIRSQKYKTYIIVNFNEITLDLKVVFLVINIRIFLIANVLMAALYVVDPRVLQVCMYF